MWLGKQQNLVTKSRVGNNKQTQNMIKLSSASVEFRDIHRQNLKIFIYYYYQ